MTTKNPTPTKVCKVCLEEKTLDMFPIHRRRGDRVWTRRDCNVCYSAKRRNAKIRVYDLVYERIKGGCVQCGEKDVRVLQFDHIDRSKKTGKVSDMITRCVPFERIEQEMDKCRVLCANCHHIHTAEQMGHYSSIYMMSRLSENREETE